MDRGAIPLSSTTLHSFGITGGAATNSKMKGAVRSRVSAKDGIFCYNRNMFYVYILKMSNKQYYIGFSEDLRTRIIDHNEGKCETTKKYRPVEMIWYSGFKDKKKALDFEKYLKSGSGTEFRHRHLE